MKKRFGLIFIAIIVFIILFITPLTDIIFKNSLSWYLIKLNFFVLFLLGLCLFFVISNNYIQPRKKLSETAIKKIKIAARVFFAIIFVVVFIGIGMSIWKDTVWALKNNASFETLPIKVGTVSATSYHLYRNGGVSYNVVFSDEKGTFYRAVLTLRMFEGKPYIIHYLPESRTIVNAQRVPT